MALDRTCWITEKSRMQGKVSYNTRYISVFHLQEFTNNNKIIDY